MYERDEYLRLPISGVRNEVKGAGILDTRENCWKFFIDRVRRQLRYDIRINLHTRDICVCMQVHG